MANNVEYKKGGKATEGVKTTKLSYVALVCALFSLFIYPGIVAIILASIDLIVGKVKKDGRNTAVSVFALGVALVFVVGFALTPGDKPLTDKERYELGMMEEGEMPSQQMTVEENDAVSSQNE